MNTTKRTLIQRIQESHDDESWEEFYSIYSRYLYIVIHNMGLSHSDSEDLMQKSLLKVWKNIDTFAYKPEQHKFRSWICTVARNTVRSWQKLKSNQSNDEFEIIDLSEQSTEPEVDQMAENEWKNYIASIAMQNIRSRFSKETIEVFELIVEGHQNSELAKKFDLELNTINKYKQRVAKALYKEISQLDQDLA